MEKTEYVHVLKDGNIRLTPKDFVNKTGPSGINISAVIISRSGVTFRWFVDFLEKKENVLDEHQTNEKTYKASRVSGDIFFSEIRGNNINVVGFSEREMPLVLAELQTAHAEVTV
jgi:hypothetical protein